MNTKDLFLLVAGVAVGHLLTTYLRRRREASLEVIASTVSIEPNTPVVNQAQIDKCNKEVSNMMMRSKFGKGADLEAIKKQKFDDCMSKSGVK